MRCVTRIYIPWMDTIRKVSSPVFWVMRLAVSSKASARELQAFGQVIMSSHATPRNAPGQAVSSARAALCASKLPETKGKRLGHGAPTGPDGGQSETELAAAPSDQSGFLA